MGKLKGKVAIVTGASKGIGAGIAKALGAEGASVIVNYASAKDGADRVVSEIVKRMAKPSLFKATLPTPQMFQRLFAEAKKLFGRVDILVNNAGVFSI